MNLLKLSNQKGKKMEEPVTHQTLIDKQSDIIDLQSTMIDRQTKIIESQDRLIAKFKKILGMEDK